MMYDTIVFKNLRFRPSTRKREATLERSVFEKTRFSTGTVFTEACGRQARQQEKSPLSTKTDTCERGLSIRKKFVRFYCFVFMHKFINFFHE